MANKTVGARIQLKNDTEANWRRAKNFSPLQGEIIIYSTDESHPFCRIKVGDGITNVNDLPFIDAQTINGIDINNLVASRLAHTLTFGAGGEFVFDGTQNVVVPVYDGTII